MIRLLLVAGLFLGTLSGADDPPKKGSISGRIVASTDGKPMPGARIFVSGSGGISAESDGDGHFKIANLNAGTYTLTTYPAYAQKTVRLSQGENVTVDFRVSPNASISGKILNADGEPMPDVSVFLVAPEYQVGALRYIVVDFAKTDDQGAYVFKRVRPGRGYLIEANTLPMQIDAGSKAPEEPKLRKKVYRETWFPVSDSVSGAQVMVLTPGERRESADFALSRSLSYCMDGVLATDSGPAPLQFFLAPTEPISGTVDGGGMTLFPSHGTAAPNGTFRICGLHPGSYRMMAFQVPPDNGTKGRMFFGSETIEIGDKDVHKMKIVSHSRVAIDGEVAWAGEPPAPPSAGELKLWLRPIGRINFMPERQSTTAAVPGQFAFPELLVDDYEVVVTHVPAGSYVKDVTYGGRSVLHEPMHAGASLGNQLRIVLAKDGGTLDVTVRDKNGQPVPDYDVALIPDGPFTEADVAGTMIRDKTDQYGTYTTNPIAPGKYFVIGSETDIDRSPEALKKLILARANAPAAELSPNGQAHVTLTLDRER